MNERTLSVQGLQIHYRIAGEGPALFILPGWGSSSEKWESVQIGIAQKGYRVIVPDLPGFGLSEPPKEVWGVEDYKNFVLELADKLGAQKFSLAGHSFGGQIAILLAATRPERIEKLMLLAAAGIRKEQGQREKKLESLAKIAKPFLSLIPSEGLRDMVRRGGYWMIGRHDYARAKGIMREVLTKVVREDVSPFFSQITSPTLILWGDQDVITPVEDAHTMKKHISGASLELLSGVGHRLRAEAPEQLQEAMVRFLQQ